MEKRVLILVAGGIVFQRGKHPALPPSIDQSDIETLFVADISLLLSDEQENFYQIITLPAPGTALHAEDKAIMVDVPERRTDLVVYDCKASDARDWIRNQLDIDRRRAEEDSEEEDEDDDDDHGDDQEEEEKEGAERPVPALVAAPEVENPVAFPTAPAALPVGRLEPEPTGELEVLEAIPLQIPMPTPSKEGA